MQHPISLAISIRHVSSVVEYDRSVGEGHRDSILVRAVLDCQDDTIGRDVFNPVHLPGVVDSNDPHVLLIENYLVN